MATNITYILIILAMLTVGGWAFKALIALFQGKPININFSNPLNLKARWPANKSEKKE